MGGTVLLVDDIKEITDVIARYLEKEGLHVDVMHKACNVVDALYNKKYDAIITDIIMPGMDGFELIEAIKKQPPAIAEIPIIVMTGGNRKADKNMIVSALQNDVQAVLKKPFTPKQFLFTLNEKILSA